jgi:hypothetical protein
MDRSRLKSALLPPARTIRRLPFGIGRGLNMGVDFHRGETRLYLGLYERELNRYLRRVVRQGYACFDIGGQYGYDALVLAKLSGGPVLSVECDPQLAEEIQENAAANPGVGPISVVTAFVSAEDDGDRVSIDSLARRFFVPDLLKIDIEGEEVQALRGASDVLTRRRPAVVLEVHGEEVERECLDLMRAAKYALPTTVDRRRWLPEHRPIDHNRWLVFCAGAGASGMR